MTQTCGCPSYTRSDACYGTCKPLTGLKIQATYTAGLLVRRHLRASLDQAGAVWREYKGLLDSIFVVDAPEDVHQALRKWINEINRQDYR